MLPLEIRENRGRSVIGWAHHESGFRDGKNGKNDLFSIIVALMPIGYMAGFSRGLSERIEDQKGDSQ